MNKTVQTGGLVDANGVSKLGHINSYFYLTMEVDPVSQTQNIYLLETKLEKNIIHTCVCVCVSRLYGIFSKLI